MSIIWQVFILFVAASFSKSEIVRTFSGPVEGTTGTSRDGRTYYVFHGIPYGEPPVESLRFKNPVPVKPWTELRNSKEMVHPCTQIDTFRFPNNNKVIGKDDCLYLNIFTPTLNPDKPLAVLFHIHGGAFQQGFALSSPAADYFMDEDVVLVSIQYRVGILGFLSLEDEIISGNFGLKDQALALAWVKSNIASFGGDTEKLTIIGESAGGASVHFLMKSPLSKDFIKQAISESGVVGKSLWVIAEKNSAKERALKVAKNVGCEGTSQEILNCLQKSDREKIVKTHNMFIVWHQNPMVPFKPVIELNTTGAFITEDPRKLDSDIPWITGVTSGEGIILTASLAVQNESIVDDFITNIDNYLPQVLCIDNINDAAKQSLKLIKEKYFSSLDRESVVNGLKELVSDGLFIAPMIDALEKHKGPKYVYLYGYRGANSIVDKYGKQPKYLGVSHVDEVILLYNRKAFYPKENKKDIEISKNLVKMWANFAQEGKPSSNWIEWKNGEYLHIKENNSMKEGFNKESANFWLKLPLYTT